MARDRIDLVTYEEARKLLSLGKTTFSKLVADGEFGDPVYVSPRSPRILQSEIVNYVYRNRRAVK